MADGPSRVSLDSLESMTDNFSQERVLGSGSYGKVYRMSTSMVKDTELINVHPLQLLFSFRSNKSISCPFHVTNNTDDQHVSVRCVPKHEGATPRYYDLNLLGGTLPPRSTHTFVVTMKQVHQLPADMDVLDVVVVPKTYPDNGRLFHEVTLKAACATACEKTTSEVLLHYDCYGLLKSMDVHPTEPWILTAYQARLVIWNYKTQTRMMEREFRPGFIHSLRKLGSSRVFVSSVRFIVKSTRQLFVVGDEDGYIHVHHCMTMKRVKEFKAHGSAVTSFALHPTQPFVLSASRDQLIKLWNWEKGWVCIRTFTGHSATVNQVKFNPHDNNTFASASGDGTVKTWGIFSPTHFTSLNCQEGQRSVDYYPTGGDQQQQHYMVTGSEWQLRPDNATARIWDLRTQTCIREIKGLESYCEVGVIDCHPDRPAVLVTASGGCGVSLHDSTTYRCERTVHFGLGKVVCVAYVKGARSLAIGHERGVAIMEID
ncbi:hypothetical protein CFC21_038915 [Triticum aestivum]|uniref:Coatomer WD associated region domain-containing protein n=3 Tax=Triticum aestivum TaxID=4565 RepID=A0A9R1FDK4_WHEAT|nr:putative coatomer subunit beta'-3 [Triticum aestivum]KAF7026823.1 hypothetical protein CFC21_038915 [Triticum aestivum]